MSFCVYLMISITFSTYALFFVEAFKSYKRKTQIR